MKIVITMTSWTKRIHCVGPAIYRFMKTTTVKPDLFYLWLAEAEFPNKEKDLPEDLLLVCSAYNVKICWTKENEYCFKRWYVYPQHYEDLVMSIDDDQIYDADILEKALKRYSAIKAPCVLSYQNPGVTYVNGITYEWRRINDWRNISPANMFLGQTIFSPKSFPLEIFENSVVSLRKKYCPKCDESIIHPFLIKNDVPIAFIASYQMMHGIMSEQANGLMQEMHNNLKTVSGVKYKKTYLQKYLVLHVFPDLQKKWLTYFPKYNLNVFNFSNDAMLEVLK